jgi:hypothetical protein
LISCAIFLGPVLVVLGILMIRFRKPFMRAVNRFYDATYGATPLAFLRPLHTPIIGGIGIILFGAAIFTVGIIALFQPTWDLGSLG